MAGPQEFLSGKLRLCFAPAARTSLLLLRLNDAALRALHECQRQQVRRRSPSSPDPTLHSGLGGGTGDREPRPHAGLPTAHLLRGKPRERARPLPVAPEGGPGRGCTCAQPASVLSLQVRPVIAFQGSRGVRADRGARGENRRGLRAGS